MSKLKRAALCVLSVLTLLSGAMTAGAKNGNVTYSADGGTFVFQPGSDRSVTDLFPEFKDMMPGDTLTQTILVRNNASEKVSVKIYLRALGAHEVSRDFLSQLTLRVDVGERTVFRAPAHEQAQLSEWVELGEFGPGGEAELALTLHMPVTLDNRFMGAVGYLDWQFRVEEFSVQPDRPDGPGAPDQPVDPDMPVDPDRPDAPKTGDAVNVGLFAGLFVGSGLLLVILLWVLWNKKKRSDG